MRFCGSGFHNRIVFWILSFAAVPTKRGHLIGRVCRSHQSCVCVLPIGSSLPALDKSGGVRVKTLIFCKVKQLKASTSGRTLVIYDRDVYTVTKRNVSLMNWCSLSINPQSLLPGTNLLQAESVTLLRTGWENRGRSVVIDWISLRSAPAQPLSACIYTEGILLDSIQMITPKNRRRWANVGLFLAQRRRRWANITVGSIYFVKKLIKKHKGISWTKTCI